MRTDVEIIFSDTRQTKIIVKGLQKLGLEQTRELGLVLDIKGHCNDESGILDQTDMVQILSDCVITIKRIDV